MATVAYIWSEELQDAADRLPANIGRSSLVHGLIKALDLLEDQAMSDSEVVEVPTASAQRATVIPPDPSFRTDAMLRRYHDDRYVDYLMSDGFDDPEDEASDESSGSRSSHPNPRKRLKATIHGLEHDCPLFPGVGEYARLVAASTVTACDLLVRGSFRTAIAWDGGRHHAMRNRASGFCYVADIVLGIMHLTKHGKGKNGLRPRVMYLDLDLHYGDGVAQAFLSPRMYPTEQSSSFIVPKPPQVLTLSIHHHSKGFFPPPTAMGSSSSLPKSHTPHPFTLSIALDAYASNSTYCRIWTSVERIKDSFDPDYVVLQLGVDGLPGDPIGGVRWCVQQVKGWGIPLCVLGGGGYEHANTARAWAVVTATLLGKDLPAQTPVPDIPQIPEFTPSFTLQVPPSYVKDENTQEILAQIDQTFTIIADRIRRIVNPAP